MNPASQRTHYKVTFAVLTVGVGSFALLQSLVTPVLPTIQHSLGTTQTDVTWVLTAYLLSASIFTPIMGRLGDMHGKKRLLVVAMVALSAGSLLAALAGSLAVMIIARVIQGVGGGVLPLAFGIIRDEFPKDRVPGAVGMVAALTSFGAGLGIVLAGPIVEALSFRWLFWLPLITTIIAGIGAQLLIPESRVRTEGKINWLTAFLLSGWLVALLLGVSQAPSWGWGSAKVIGLLVVALGVALIWVIAESRSPNPLIDMKMMRIRTVWAANLVALLMGVGMYSAFGFLPQFLQTPPSAGYGFGASVTTSGLIMLPSSVGMFILGLISGRLIARFGSKNLLVSGAIVCAISYFALAFRHATELEIFLIMGFTGIGLGLAFSSMANVVVAAVPPEQTGVASGMNTNIRTVGGSVGAAFMATIVAGGTVSTELPQESGYTQGFIMLGCAVSLAAVAALCIPTATRRRTKVPNDINTTLTPSEVATVATGGRPDRETLPK